MTRTSIGTSALLAALFVAGTVLGHRATEVYIPIGQSPGVSGEYTMIGEVDGMEEATGVLRMTGEADSKSYQVRCDKSTSVYLDRSRLRQRSEVGGLEDLGAGARVEVKYADEEHTVAEWIKIEIVD